MPTAERVFTVGFMRHIRELWRTDRGRLVHYFVAVDLAIVLVVEMALNEEVSDATLALAAAAALALLFTRDFPFLAPLVVGALFAVIVGIDGDAVYDMNAPFLIVLFVPWVLGTYNGKTKAILGLAAYQVLAFWVNLNFPETEAADYFFIPLFVAVPWTTGFVLSRRSAQMRAMAERARQAELEREHAVIEERNRIARELHDVIAHSVSVMTVQTGAVRRLLHADQQKEREALEVVESTGRQALTEMRRLVGLLREQGAMPEFSPQPGMKTIDLLLDGVRAAGLPVELEIDGEPSELPPGVDLAAYRVVQEALTNALKYAGPAHAWVAVGWHESELELTISNDGRGDGDGTGGGRGLDGLRERVSMYGGQVRSGPREGGGYVVHARLPIGEGAV
jgi:signal transduction histidine kinase